MRVCYANVLQFERDWPADFAEGFMQLGNVEDMLFVIRRYCFQCFTIASGLTEVSCPLIGRRGGKIFPPRNQFIIRLRDL